METKHGLVHFYRIIGTDHVIAKVYEPGAVMNTHSSITTFGGVWHGELGTRVLPPEIEALPRGDARLKAVYAHRDAQNARVRSLVKQVTLLPELAEHCARTPMDCSLSHEVSWHDQRFADAIGGMETDFPVTWKE